MAKTKNKNGAGALFKGAAWIALGGFVAKVIGALYRIPLTNVIGGKGIGLYQMVYPVYCLLLTVSSSGIPSSIAKLTAEKIGRGESAQTLLKTAMRLFLIIGALGTVLMCIVSPLLVKAQGSEEVLFGYYALAPSVFIVAIISVFRGYFQGKNKMFPTAASEIIEQLVKVGVGLFFAWKFQDNVALAVVYLLLAVSISELVACLFMVLVYRRHKRRETPLKTQNDGGRVAMKHILRISLPVTVSAGLIPLSSLIDSVFAVRLLGKYASDSVSLYGLFAGGAVTVINLPVSICYGIAAASIPAVALAKAQTERLQGEKQTTVKKRVKNTVRRKWLFSLIITATIALPAAVGLYLFAEPIAKIIYKNLKQDELQTLSALIRAFSLSAFTLSCAQTLSACLTAQGKPQHSALSMGVGMAVKTAVYAVLLKNPQISVFGLAYATNIGYLVAFFMDLVYNFVVSRPRGEKPTRAKGQEKEKAI